MQLEIGTPLPKFSIIMPSFNRAHIIERAIASMKLQTFNDWELLIIDDGSRDESFRAVRHFVLDDPRIRYHFASNRGLAMARNIGVQMSRGSFITFLDTDDWYDPAHLALRARYLDANPAVTLLHGGVEVIGSAFVADKFDPTRLIPISECVVGGTFFIRRDLVTKLGGFRDVAYGDDYEFFARAEASGAEIRRVDFPTYIYDRTQPDSLCNIVERDGIEGIEQFRQS